MIKKKCKICDKEFEVYNYRKETATCCSRFCSNIFKKENIPWNKGIPHSRKTKEKISKSVLSQYKNGTRDRFTITKNANEALRQKTRDKLKHGKLTTMIGKRGYRLVYLPERGWISEHHWIWEQYNGCRVPNGFHIHHKNGDKLDNRIKNLELISASEHLKLHYKERQIESCGRFL